MPTPIDKVVQELNWFLRATQAEVVRRFSSIPTSRRLEGPKGHGPIILIPSTVPDPVLLVAHYDTVWDSWNKNPVNPLFKAGVFYSNDAKGIGADDRAGCALLWFLRNMGHSLLLCPGEEVGCAGSRFAEIHYLQHLQGHSFALQFDRHGASDLVPYECNNPGFIKYLQEWFPGYKEAFGSCTDIKVLGPALKIAACNLSVGFYSEHTAMESLRVGDFLHTFLGSQALLQAKTRPSFVHVPRFTQYYQGAPKARDRTAKGYIEMPKLVGYPPNLEEDESSGEIAAHLASIQEEARQRRAAPLQTQTTGAKRPFRVCALSFADTPTAITNETEELFCEECGTFVLPGNANWDASNVLTCPSCNSQLRLWFPATA